MKLKGNFILRQVVGEWIAVPVGETTLKVGGMIVLNPVSRVIWQVLDSGADMDAIVQAVTDQFDVTEDEARSDVAAFIQQMRAENLIIE